VVLTAGQVLAGQRKEGARGRRAGGGLPHEQDAVVQRWVGEAESDQPGGTVQPGRGQDRHAQLLGRQLDDYAQVAGLSGDPGAKPAAWQAPVMTRLFRD
jgi:hypothetical protein